MLELDVIHILLAEDNPTDVMLVELALKKHAIDCELLVMSDGAEVLRFFRDLDGDSILHAPDLVLLDLHLPKHDGREIIRRLRASERCSGTEVVVMSSSDSPKARADAEKHCARYFRKPSGIEAFMELGAIVKDALQKKPAWRFAKGDSDAA
jgi:CheY-like chemotaxis protein